MKEQKFWRSKELGAWAVTLGLAALLVAGGIWLDKRNLEQEEQQAQVLAEQQQTAAEQAAQAALAQLQADAAAKAREEENPPAAAPEQDPPAAQSPEQAPPAPLPQETAQNEPQQPQQQDYQEDGLPRQEEAITVSAGPIQFVMPVKGEILRGHGYAYDPTTEDYRFHRGVDLAASAGEAVRSAAGGKVTAAAEDAFWGGIVVVDHGGGWSSAYRGLDPQVEAGDQVEAGSLLGTVLESIPGEAAQPGHLHVELLLEGDSLDPSAWL